MYKAFRYNTDAGAYWSVIDDDTYDRVDLADRFLQYMRFARGRAESTTRKYAEAIALYHRYCISRGRCWDDPDITAFQFAQGRTLAATVTIPRTGLGGARTQTDPKQQPHQPHYLCRLRNVQIRGR
jgi:hypothetical protein